jgi:hypothetical protein
VDAQVVPGHDVEPVGGLHEFAAVPPPGG